VVSRQISRGETGLDSGVAGTWTVRKSLREVVGQARDAMANYGCFPSGAQTFNTALETLPR
jgi:hypothetical protein